VRGSAEWQSGIGGDETKSVPNPQRIPVKPQRASMGGRMAHVTWWEEALASPLFAAST